MIKVSQPSLRRKANAIELATGDGSIKIFDSIGDFVDFKDASKLSEVFFELLKVPNFSLSAVRGVSSTVAYLLCHSSFFRSFIPANEVGLTLVHAIAWSAILTQRCDNGKRLGDVIAASTAYLDASGQTQLVNPLNIFSVASGTTPLQELAKLLNAADEFNSTLKDLQSRALPAFVKDDDKNLKGAASHPTWSKAKSLVDLAHSTFGTIAPNSYIPPIALLFNLLVQVQKDESDSLPKLGADPVLFNTSVKKRIELPEILDWEGLCKLVREIGKAAIQREAYAKFSRENASVAALQGDVKNSAYMGASLFTIDPNKYAEKFLDVANAYESAVVEANYTYQRFDSKVDKLEAYLLTGAVADALGYAGNDEIVFNDAAKTAFALLLQHYYGTGKMPGAQTMTKSAYANAHWSMAPVMSSLIRVLSLYEDISYEDVRKGFKVILDGSLSSRVAICVERTVFHTKSYIAGHPVFSREPRDDDGSKVAITKFGLEVLNTNKFIPDSLGIRTNQKISKDDFKVQSAGGLYASSSTLARGSTEYLAETLNSDTLEMESVVNDQASSVVFSAHRKSCWWICPAWHTRSLGTGANVEFLFSCKHNSNSGSSLTTYKRVSANDLAALCGVAQVSDLGKYLNIVIEGHSYDDHVVTGTEEVSPQLLNGMLASIQRIATSTPCLVAESVQGMESEYFDKMLVDAGSSAVFGQSVLSQGVNTAFALTGEELVSKLSPLCGEIEVFSATDRSLACKIYKLLVTTYIASAASSLLEGGSGRYKDCVPNGRYVKSPNDQVEFTVPLISLPQATRAAIEKKSGVAYYAIEQYGRTVLELRLKRDKSGKVINDSRFGALVQGIVHVQDHGNPDKSNLIFNGVGSFKGLFKSDDNMFYYPREYGVSALDNVDPYGNVAPTLHKVALLGERASKVGRAPTLILSDNKEPVNINSLIVSPLAAKCLSIKVEQSEKDLALDIVDERWPRASLYIATLVAGLYATVSDVVLDAYAPFFDFEAFVANIKDFRDTLTGAWKDDFTPYIIGVGNNMGLKVSELSDFLDKVLFSDLDEAKAGKEHIANLLKVLDNNALSIIDKAEIHDMDLAAFPLCTSMECLEGISMVSKILSNDIVDWLPYVPIVSGLKNFGEEVLGPELGALISFGVARVMDAKVNCLKSGKPYGEYNKADKLPAEAATSVEALTLTKDGDLRLDGKVLRSNFVCGKYDGTTWVLQEPTDFVDDVQYGMFDTDGATLKLVYGFKVKDQKVVPAAVSFNPYVAFNFQRFDGIKKFVNGDKFTDPTKWGAEGLYQLDPFSGKVKQTEASGLDKDGFFVVDFGKGKQCYAIYKHGKRFIGRALDRAVYFEAKESSEGANGGNA